MKSRFLAVTAVSFLMLLLELTFTRVLSFVYWNHVVYMIVSIVLLGYGIGAIFIIIFRSGIERYGFDRVQGTLLVIFSFSVPLSMLVTSRLPIPIKGADISFISVSGPLLANYLFFVLPFVFLGAFVVNYFFDSPQSSGLLYLLDLIGAGAGCLAFPYLLERLGAPSLSLAAASAGLAIGGVFLFFSGSRPGRAWSIAFAVCMALLASSWIFRGRVAKLRPVSTKILARAYSYPGAKIEYTRWDPGARIDIASADDPMRISGRDFPVPGLPHKVLTNDGDAYTAIIDANFYSMNAGCEKIFRFLQSSPYTLYPPENVLIIGTGGGPDIIKALGCGSGQIDGVEVAGATIDAMKGPYAEYSGGIYLKPNVTVYHDEGRSFLRRSGKKYNVIQMSGVDTFSALAGGAYVLAENYLYTVDAVDDYIEHLDENGFIVIRRWYFQRLPRETLRLFVLAFHALGDMGVKDPGRHIFINGKLVYANTTVKKTAFTDAETAAFEREVERVPEFETIFHPGADYCAKADENPFYEYACAYSRNEEARFFEKYFYDVSPVYDDDPFFFNYYKLSNMFKSGGTSREWRTGYWAYRVLGLILAQSALLICVFIFGPLLVFRREGLKLAGAGYLVVYFACLGLGFIVVEISLMQQLTLFLGLPVYSIAVVLSGLLISAGLGSYASGRAKTEPVKLLAALTALLAVIMILAGFGLQSAMRHYLGAPFPARAAIALVAVFPLGFVMGFYFPMGLVAASRSGADFVPWAWGINAGFTVIGSIVAVIAAMMAGFKAILPAAAVLYIVAWLSIKAYHRKLRN